MNRQMRVLASQAQCVLESIRASEDRLFFGKAMGLRNYLIEGVSCSGKTTVGTELQRRGYHVIHGDRELAYRGDPRTGARITDNPDGHLLSSAVFSHTHHIWDEDKVRNLISDTNRSMTFFCGGSRNVKNLVRLFDKVFVLHIGSDTLRKRLDQRPRDEFGSKADEKALIMRLHATGEDIPKGQAIDAEAPLDQVVENILSLCDVGERVWRE